MSVDGKNMNHYLLIKDLFKSEYFRFYYTTPQDLKDNNEFMKFLRNRHVSKKESYRQYVKNNPEKCQDYWGKDNVKCSCKKHNVNFDIRQHKEKYLLARAKNTEHSIDCPFYKERDDYIKIVDGEEKYTTKIFEEPKTTKSTRRPRASESDIERNTYYNYCQNMISSANSFAFNALNKPFSKEDFIPVRLSSFCKYFKTTVLNTKISSFSNIKNYCDSAKGVNYTYGFIEESLHDIYNDNNNLSDDDLITINYLKSEEKDNQHIFDSKDFEVSKKRLEISLRRIKIYDNYIRPPYAFFAVKEWKRAIRLYLYPVHLDIEKNELCFVESDYERKYAKKLFLNNTAFLKPISNTEFARIKKEKIVDDVDKDKKPFLRYRADFIEFNNNKICLTEVSGFDNKDYISLLTEKEKEYQRLNDKFDYIEYKVINGRDL